MSAFKEQPVVRISIQGVTEKMKNMLEYFFRESGDNYCDIVDVELADLSIIDVDGVQSQQAVEKHKLKYPHQPFIILSARASEIDNAILIHKPVQPEILMSTIESIYKKNSIQKEIENNDLLNQDEIVTIKSKDEVLKSEIYLVKKNRP